MDITLHLNRAAGVVGVDVATNMRGVLFKQLVSAQGEKKMAVRSGAEQEVSPARLVLALDYSGSMGSYIGDRPRVEVVREAAKTMVDELMVTPHVSIGIVPWADQVCQHQCLPGLGVLSPTNLPNRVHLALDRFAALGRYTFSPAGINESMLMLRVAPPNEKRGLVLLTDGGDTICQQNGLPEDRDPTCTAERRTRLREEACDAAKAEDITIWVVAAMRADQVDSQLGRELRDCASDGDQHVFVSNVDANDLEDAFESISTQVKALRRTY